MKTFQDFQRAQQENNLIDFLTSAISEYRSSADYRTALDADEYSLELHKHEHKEFLIFPTV